MCKISLFLVLFFLVLSSGAQTEFETIEKDIETRNIDTVLVLDLVLLAENYLKTDSIKSRNFYLEGLSNAELLKYPRGKALAMFGQGNWEIKWSKNYSKSENLFIKSLEICKEHNLIETELEIIQRLTALYDYLGEPTKGISLLNESLKLHSSNNLYQAILYNSLGTIYKANSDGMDGTSYYDKSQEKIDLEPNPSEKFNRYILSNDKNRGVIYRNNLSFDTASFYFNKSLQFSEKISDSSWIARNYNSIAIMYQMQGKNDKAIETYQLSLEIKRSLGYADGVMTTLSNLATLYVNIGKYQKAKECLIEAEEISEEVNSLSRRIEVKKAYSLYFASTKQYENAYNYLSTFYILKDSLDKIENFQEAKKLEAIFQNENNKILQEKLEADLAASDLREENKSAQIKSQQNIIVLSSAIGIMMLGLIIYIIFSNIKRKKANLLLQEKNIEVLEKNRKIEVQNHEIEEKNQEMLDSINYAKRIQDAILPNPVFFKENLQNSFIYYQPKDVLAGDFYWMDVIEDYIIWAAADCTGHGIPGAMVSVVCHNALNRSVHESGLRDPGEILDSTRELVIDTFIKSGYEVKDGMDIAICCYRPEKKELLFAGANNPIWIIRKKEDQETLNDNEFEDPSSPFKLIETKGDKQPVGLHFAKEKFKTHKIRFQANDLVYLFTDGFADQFGGLKGKKLKNKNFKKLLLEIGSKDINTQGDILSEEFNKWKADFEQLDDVCVIGVQL